MFHRSEKYRASEAGSNGASVRSAGTSVDASVMAPMFLMPANRSIACNSTGGMKSVLRNVDQQHSMPAARHLVPMTKQPPAVVLENTVRDAVETEYAGQSVY
ncbi:hypothetical protein [Mesorhizobium sp.]|uniref:hypothetical protein n=1 Tax=Mesorhizobium sp. TaxID=1871066 RepID=UPI00257B4C64|nr:hypothetical protein [Mesorhizobium sp.]